ncbi:hypothetical protein C8R43DRAFT_1121859 [Mycena crocata]|nr:hypothetical protein C8R43DRAFT_1121859 [Mycena crocata]
MAASQKPFASSFNRNEGLTLMQLPLDTLIQILQFADPVDIFSISQTCRVWLDVALSRTVWLSALRRMCETNCLFKPSFPMDSMSLLELQDAATSAGRFTKRLYKREGDAVTVPLAPFVRRSFTPRVVKTSNVASEIPGELKTVHLVPGGRFLIVATATLVHLCDLGHGANKLIKPHALASTGLLQAGEPETSILPTPDGTGLEVMITLHHADIVKGFTVAVYRIYPAAAHPEFILVTEPRVLAGTVNRAFLAKPGHCILHAGPNLYLWDTARNLWASWKADEPPKKVFGFDDMIIGVGAKTITVWEMPTAHCDTVEGCFLDKHRPILALAHPFPARHLELEITMSTDWFCATSTRPCCISIIGWKSDSRQIARYTLQPLDRATNHNLPSSIPILMDTVVMSGETEWAEEIQPCGQNALTVWTSLEAPAIEVHISPMPLTRQAEPPAFKSVRLFESPSGDSHPHDFKFSLCPISGRLCTMVGVNEIVVSDFLLPHFLK